MKDTTTPILFIKDSKNQNNNNKTVIVHESSVIESYEPIKMVLLMSMHVLTVNE